jgi:hypothetical protein
LPLVLVLVAEAERTHTPRQRSVFVAAALAAVVGVLAYQVVPATGPIYAFAGYPAGQPVLGAFALANPVEMLAPRNAMPSLHLTWALLVAWHAVRSGRLAGALGIVFLSLTTLAALALGEHYVIDLVMAVPFAVAIAAAVAGYRRLATACFLVVAVGLIGIASVGWPASR